MYVVGQTGVGKSTMLKSMIQQDIQSGRGICLIEPHGDLVLSIYKSIENKDDVIYFDATDSNISYGYNPLRKVSFDKRALVTSGILEVLKKLWVDAWGVKLEHILRYTLLALLDQPSAHFGNILDMLLDKHYRREAKGHIVSESVKDFWENEFPKYMPYDLMPIYNKVGGFLAYPIVRKILVENKETLSLRSIMDKGQVLLVNVAKGHIGSDVSHILGAMLISSLTSAAFSRVEIPEEERKPFYIYLDEFHNYTTLSLINMFSELRKFRIGMVVAHQYLHQLETDVQQAILGNVGTKIIFRVGYHDSVIWAREMKPYFVDTDFMNLPNRHIYLILMIDGVPSKPFSAVTLLDQN
jgi:type IV secretory pathway TraG/TraD family ATPase VirD4